MLAVRHKNRYFWMIAKYPRVKPIEKTALRSKQAKRKSAQSRQKWSVHLVMLLLVVKMIMMM